LVSLAVVTVATFGALLNAVLNFQRQTLIV